MSNFQYSSAGLDLTEKAEGLVLKAYKDPVGIWTIGYGHTGTDVTPGLVITQQQAETLLEADVQWAVTCVNKAVTSNINQNQFDALVDFVFNLGCTAFLGSTLLRKLNASDFAGAAAEFPRWNKAKGRVLPGLTKRRAAEQALFNTPVGSTIMAAAMIPASAAALAAKKPTKATKKAVAKKAAKKSAPKKAAKAKPKKSKAGK